MPSALFAARLKAKSGAETILSWMIGEALKMGVTVAMFVAIAFWYNDVRWVPLLVTYLVALKTYWMAMVWRWTPARGRSRTEPGGRANSIRANTYVRIPCPARGPVPRGVATPARRLGDQRAAEDF